MTWVLNATGETNDPAKHQSLMERIGAILNEAEYGTGSSQFSGVMGLIPHFHKQLPPAATDAPGDGVTVQDAPPPSGDGSADPAS